MIGSGTFRDCKLVKEIILPSSLLKIGSKAFYGCISLTEIVIPESVKSIAKDAMVTSYGQQATIVADEGSYAAKYVLKNGIAYKSGKI